MNNNSGKDGVGNDTIAEYKTATHRISFFDVLRGLALIAMIIYHFSWDLQFFNLIPVGTIDSFGWRMFARTIAASFLILVGISLYLAHGASGKNLNFKAYIKRLLLVGLAALIITIATYYIFPQNYIFFGILHCIALSSILALPLLRLPAWFNLLMAITIFILAQIAITPILNAPYWYWLGLGESIPQSNDYEPIFPWFGFVVLGLSIAKFCEQFKLLKIFAQWQFNQAPFKFMRLLGRNSLLTYLIHQPIMIALVYGVVTVFGLETSQKQVYLESCIQSCQVNASEAQCQNFCPCVIKGFEDNGNFEDILSGKLNLNDDEKSQATINQCSIESRDAE